MKTENIKAPENHAGYGKFYVRVQKETSTFACGYEGNGEFWRDVRLKLTDRDSVIVPEIISTEWKQPDFKDYTLLTVRYCNPDATLRFKVKRDGIYADLKTEKGAAAYFCGILDWGDVNDCFAVRRKNNATVLRNGVGPAVSVADDSLFDRASDSSVVFYKGAPGFTFDWKENKYRTALVGNKWHVGVEREIYTRTYRVPYRAINKRNTFPAPPVGWMTWYAVQFDACEKKVLDNAARMKELFGKFGASVVWVDWEWYHSTFHAEGPEGIDYFHPDPVRYPDGLRCVADRIDSMGLTPALWIGITHEPGNSEFVKTHPDAVLAREPFWCGQYIFDITNEIYRKEYVPAAVEKIRDWHYRAVKWDCLPITLWATDRYHDCLSDTSVTSEQALRAIVSDVREKLGDDFYMLSCAGAADREIRFAADIFDGARIGGDIFTWKEFVEHFAARIVRMYPYHNVLFYCDPDNVVLRKEHNTLVQAVSRASLVSLLGLPFTMGDDLTELSDDRVEIIKRCIPPLDAHPCDIGESALKRKVFTVNQCISRPFEQWDVTGVTNLSGKDTTHTVVLKESGIAEGRYVLFEFWSKMFCGICNDEFSISLAPYETKVFSVRRYTGTPQLLATSRHISCGGTDVRSVRYDEKTHVLSGESDVVGGDEYVLYAYDPAVDGMVTKRYLPDKTGIFSWEICFD